LGAVCNHPQHAVERERGRERDDKLTTNGTCSFFACSETDGAVLLPSSGAPRVYREDMPTPRPHPEERRGKKTYQ
jgi:hypothetical protein